MQRTAGQSGSRVGANGSKLSDGEQELKMAQREFVSLIHKSTPRDYLARVTQRDKAEVAEIAIQFD